MLKNSKALFWLASASSLTSIMQLKDQLDVGLSSGYNHGSCCSNIEQVGLNRAFFLCPMVSWLLEWRTRAFSHPYCDLQYREDRACIDGAGAAQGEAQVQTPQVFPSRWNNQWSILGDKRIKWSKTTFSCSFSFLTAECLGYCPIQFPVVLRRYL
jgi:hypothetical protein